MIVVIFQTKLRDDADLNEYEATSKQMNDLVGQIPGFISIKGYVAEDGEEIGIARFESEEALAAWRHHPEHVEAQRKGREQFYDSYRVEVCATIREYEYHQERRHHLAGT